MMNSSYMQVSFDTMNDILSFDIISYIKKQNPLFENKNLHKLNQDIETFNGYAFKSNDWKKDYNNKVGTNFIPVLKISNIEKHIVSTQGFDYVDKTKYSKQNMIELKKNDIVIAMSGSTCGKFGIIEFEEKCFVNQRVLVIRIKNGINVLPEYLIEFIQVCTKNIIAKASGLGLKNISDKDYLNFKTKDFPSLEEQERTLPLVKAKIKILEDKIKELEEEKKANDFNHLLDKYLGEMLGIKIPSINDFSNSIITTRNFDDIVEKLSIDANMGDFSYLKNSKYDITNINKLYKKGIITKIQDGSHLLSPKNNDLDDNGYYYIQCGNLTPNGFTLSSLKRVTKNFYNNVGQGYVEENDVLLSVMGTIGISCVLKKKIDGVINVAIMFIRTNTKYINPQYLSYWLNSIFFNYQIMIDKTNMSRDQISAKKLLRSKIILPDKETQDKIVEQLEELLTYNPYWDNKIKELQSIIDDDLNKYILNGYSDDLFEIPKGE